MGWGVIIVGVAAVALVTVAGAGTYSCAFDWHRVEEICTGLTILDRWQTLFSGILALFAAATTVYYLRQQIIQAVEIKSGEERREATVIANTILMDLLETSSRLRRIRSRIDLDPSMSELARQLRRDAFRIDPSLAAALQQHCSEIITFENRLKAAPVPTYGAAHLQGRKELGFRAMVLARCFGGASESLRKTGKATGPFIDRKELTEIEHQMKCGSANLGYLNHVFSVTGLG